MKQVMKSLTTKDTFPLGAQPEIWCTAEGTEIPVYELERSHIRSIVAMLMRSVFKHKLRIASTRELRGEKLKKLLAMPDSTFLSKYCPTWDALMEEMVERGLSPSTNE